MRKWEEKVNRQLIPPCISADVNRSDIYELSRVSLVVPLIFVYLFFSGQIIAINERWQVILVRRCSHRHCWHAYQIVCQRVSALLVDVSDILNNLESEGSERERESELD